MEITAAAVKELRERTGAGFMDCKRALEEAGGDIDKAIAEQGLTGQLEQDPPVADRAGRCGGRAAAR